jgi:hypothetical protein
MWFSAFFLLFALKKIRSVLFFILFLIYFLFFRFLFLRQVILRKDTFFKSRSHRNSQTPSASMTTQDTCYQQDDDEHATGAGHTNADVLGDPADVGADAGVHVGRRSRQGSGVVRVRAQGADQLWKK